MRTRRPLSHPLADVFWRAVDSIAASLSPDTVRGYRAVTRSFLRYLGADHHEIRSLKQLRRDPHILGWLAHLRSRTPPIVLATHVNNVVRLRHILEELAWNEQMPDLAHLLRHDDSPRRERKIPRPLTAEHDQLLQQELVRRNDLASNVLFTPPHRYAHRRVRRSIFRLPARWPSWGMGNSCPALQNENRTAGSGGFICLPTGAAPPIFALARSDADRRLPSGAAARKGDAASRTP
jgi:hypothetical protein